MLSGSTTFGKNTCPSSYSPLGILFVSKDESAEHVLFMYPFNPDLTFEGELLQKRFC